MSASNTQKEGLNTITGKSTMLTTSEVSGLNTVWDNLLALSKFAGTSKPERSNAIKIIRKAINEYEMREWHKEVLEGVISILKIEPRA